MALEKKVPYRRRIIVVKKKLQLKYAGLIFMSVLIAVIIIACDMYYGIGQVLVEKINPEMRPLILKINNLLMLKLLIYLLIVMIISLFVSHRFAGPIFRFERAVDTVAKGDLTERIRLRSTDDLKEVAVKMNTMIESLQKKVKEDKLIAAEIGSELSVIVEKINKSAIGVEEKRAMIQHLESLVKKSQNVGKGFTV